MKSLISCTIALALLLTVTAQGKSSVKWRRVSRPSSTTSPYVREEPFSTTRSSITWRRSTISRRSTTQTEPTLLDEEIAVAESKEDSVFIDDGPEDEPSFKPLVPGSRPGFWLDSSRRKKPGKLLRPGTRKSSLFPMKLSTLISQNLSDSVTTSPAIQLKTSTIRTTTDLTSSTEKSKLFSLNRSTKPPISFRRKIKTTKAPSTTTETSELKDILKETKSSVDLPLNKTIEKDTENDVVEINEDIKGGLKLETEKIRKNNRIPLPGIRRRIRNETGTDLSNTDDFQRETKSPSVLPSTKSTNLNTENKDVKITETTEEKKLLVTEIPRKSTRSPLPGIRRRTRNGTRLAWKNESNRITTKPTEVPKQTSTTIKYSAGNNDRYLRKTSVPPKIRSRTRANKTTTPTRVSWTKNKYTTLSPTILTEKTEKNFASKLKGPTNYLRNRNTHRFNRLKVNSSIKKDSDNDIQDFNSQVEEESIKPPSSAKIIDKKIPTTEEPFFVTREYGQVVTAIELDIPKKISRTTYQQPISRTTSTPRQTTTELTTVTELVDYTEGFNYTNEGGFENEFVEFDDVSETDEFQSLKTDEPLFQYEEMESNRVTTPPPELETTPKPPPPTPKTTAKPSTTLKMSTTPRPLFSITPPLTPPTIEPGANAYVVWSLGQDGSGWSYQKQGGQVTWTAQNSEIAGDRWSVQGKEEPLNIPNSVWAPTRNTSYIKDVQSQKVTPKNTEIVPSEKLSEGVSFTPSVPYLNETPLKIKSTTEDFKLAPLTTSEIFPHFQTDPFSIPLHFTPSAINTSQVADDKTNTQDEPQEESTTGTSEELALTGDTETELNPLGSISQNSSADSPYLIEFRDTFEADVPNLFTETSTDFPESFTTNTNLIQNLEGESFYFRPPSPEYEDIQVDDPSTFIDEPSEYKPPTQSEARQVETDLSGLPPALAKAVVESKRWTIIGTGDHDGWSLYGEDGKLEWRIHNTGGKWSVTSPDDIPSYDDAAPETYQNINNQETQINNQNNVETDGKGELKVWTLDDDYEKWRLVSAENAPKENHLQENQKLNNDYDYPQKEETETDNDYYDENEDYNFEQDGEEQFDEEERENVYPNDFDGRPLWGENQMIQNPQDHQYPNDFIEEANTKQDAIDAWKSLLIDQGRWKFADSEEILDQDYQSKSLAHIRSFSPNVLQEESDWKVSSGPITVRNKQAEKPDAYSQQDFQTAKNLPNQNNLRNRNEEKNAEESLRSLDKYTEVLEHKLREADHERARPYADYSESREISEDGNYQNGYETSLKSKPGDHGKVDKLINKLETLHREANGKAVVDLSQLIKLIKANRNVTSKTKEGSMVNDNQENSQTEFSNSQKQNDERVTEYSDSPRQHRLKKPYSFNHPPSELFDEQMVQSNKQLSSNLQKENRYRNPQEIENTGILNDYAEYAQQFKLKRPETYNYLSSRLSEAEKIHVKNQLLLKIRQQEELSYNQQIEEAAKLKEPEDNSRQLQKKRPESISYSPPKLSTDERSFVDTRSYSHNTHSSKLQYDDKIENQDQRSFVDTRSNSHKTHSSRLQYEDKMENQDERSIVDTRLNTHKTHSSRPQYNDKVENQDERSFADPRLNSHKTHSSRPQPLDTFENKDERSSIDARLNTHKTHLSRPQYKDKIENQGERSFVDTRLNSHKTHSSRPQYNDKIENQDERSFIDTRLNTHKTHSSRPQSVDKIENQDERSFVDTRSNTHKTPSSGQYNDKIKNQDERSHVDTNLNSLKSHSSRPQYDDKIENQDERSLVDTRLNSHKTHSSRPQYDDKIENQLHNSKQRRKQNKIKPNSFNKDENSRNDPTKHLTSFHQVEQEQPNTNLLPLRISGTQKEQKASVRDVMRQLERRNRRPSNYRFTPTDEPRYKSFSTTPATDEDESNNSEEQIDIRAQPIKTSHDYENGHKHNPLRSRRPEKRRHRKQHNHNSAPIVLSGETEIEDEDGLKKNRKIIVIDYAGKQKKKSSIDRKDLELIIRNVRNRRSGQAGDSSEENLRES